MVTSQDCVQQWAELFSRKGVRGSLRHVDGKKCAAALPRHEGRRLWDLREQHEGEHCAMMKFVRKEAYGGGRARVCISGHSAHRV
jgi:hypothetical protein